MDPAIIKTPFTACTLGSPSQARMVWKNNLIWLGFLAFLVLDAGLDLDFVFALDLNMLGRTLKQ